MFSISIVILSILISSLVVSRLLQKVKLPLVIGEIIGGLILGPTILGFFFPEFFSENFKIGADDKPILDGVYNIGLFGIRKETYYCRSRPVNSSIGKIYL